MKPEPATERTVYRTCTFCEACCGIEVKVEGERVRRIRGDPLDALSRGYICPKAPALADLHEDPDRLRRPMARTRGGSWQAVGWREAFDRAAEGLLAVQREHGLDAVALYRGEPVTHNLGATLFGPELTGALGTRNHFSANSTDQFPKQLVSHLMYGSGLLLSVPDVDRCSFMLIVGANPVVSNGSLLTAPGMRERLVRVRERGGRVVVLDPVRTATAEIADEHHFVRPGSDALLMAALCHVLLEEGLARPGPWLSLLDGLPELETVLEAFSPESISGRTGIDAGVVRGLARAFAGAASAVCYGRMGVSTAPFAAASSWLVEVLNILSGNFDREGGAMFPRPAVDVAALDGPTQRGRFRSRTRGTSEFMGELPAATLVAEIETPGVGQVRALVTLAGNPVLSVPGGRRLDAALDELDFMVAIDFYRNETTRHADLILPPCGPLERDHFDIVFGLFAARNVPRWSPAVFTASPESRSDAQILLELSRRLRAGRGVGGRMLAGLERGLLALGPARAERLALALALRSGPYGSWLRPWRGISLRRLRSATHGVDLGPMCPNLAERLRSKVSGCKRRIGLAPAELVAELRRAEKSPGRVRDALLLVGRREPRTLNSWSHNLPKLVSGRSTYALWVHPSDARARGLEEGSIARVASDAGAIRAPVSVRDAVMPGVVSLPHGYGHDREGVDLNVASQQRGASINDLCDPNEIDPLSGNAVLNALPVRVERDFNGKREESNGKSRGA